MNPALHNIGMVGLGTMGRNLVLNIGDHGFSVIGYDKDAKQADMLNTQKESRPITATSDIEAFMSGLERPRKIILLVPAGNIVDIVIQNLLPYLSEGDIVIDSGNSFFQDTERRFNELKEKNIHFMGMGVSGGEEGARFGPSMMPGGDVAAYDAVKEILEAISAKVDGQPCVTYVGRKSAGHYVKMVHNGIEYAIMQLISEVFQYMQVRMGLDYEQAASIFDQWNQNKLKSFLIEITGGILKKKDPETGNYLVSMILDKARQKGTGKWTSQNAMDIQVPVPSIDMAVTLRDLSAYKDARVALSALYPKNIEVDKEILPEDVENALYAAVLLSYIQGFAQLTKASSEYGFEVPVQQVASIWKGGCIIRSVMLDDFEKAFAANAAVETALLNASLAEKMKYHLPFLRKLVADATINGIPVAAFSSAIAYFDAFTTETLPVNLIQAQRDCFGAHTYERKDKPGIFHTPDWLD